MEESAPKRRKIEEIPSEPDAEGSEVQPSPSEVITKRNIFGETCNVCQVQPGKYRCPGCEVIVCSLQCTKQHRKDSLCTGKRIRTEYKEIREMTDEDLVKDVYLLHQANESSKTARKVAQRVPGSAVRGLPKRLRVLHQEAKKLDIALTFLPGFMQKHKDNTTFFDYKRVMILWRCEFVFAAKPAPNVFVVPNVEDVKTFGEFLSEQLRGKRVVIPDHLRPKRRRDRPNQDGSNDATDDGQTSNSAETAEDILDMRLAELVNGTVYGETSPESWVILLRHEKCPANEPLFHRIFSSDNLRRTLKFHEVIEFPTLIVLPSEDFLNQNSATYPIYSKERFQEMQNRREQEERARLDRAEERQRVLEEMEARREEFRESQQAGTLKLDAIAKEMGLVTSEPTALSHEDLVQALQRKHDNENQPENEEHSGASENSAEPEDSDDEEAEEDSSSSQEDSEEVE